MPREEDSFSVLPPEEEREALIEELEALCRKAGEVPLGTAPVVLPNPEFFPDPWSPDLAGASGMVGRLLQYAGLGHLGVAVNAFSERTGEDPFASGVVRHSEGAAAYFLGIRDDCCFFEVEAEGLAAPDYLAGVLAHEVAHAYRNARGLVVEDRDLEEQLTDLTTVFLGFGVLSTNSSDQFRSSGDARVHRWSRRRAGYLSPSSMGFLLAAQLVARGNDREVRAVKKVLEANQRGSFVAAMKVLLPRAEELRERFGVVRVAVPPTPVRMSLPPVSSQVADPLPEPVPEREGRPVFRVRRPDLAQYVYLAFPLFGAALLWAGLVDSVFPLLLGPAALWTFGRLWQGHCSACTSHLGRKRTRCPKCRGVIVGEIPRTRDRLGAMERFEREHGVAAEPDEDSIASG